MERRGYRLRPVLLDEAGSDEGDRCPQVIERLVKSVVEVLGIGVSAPQEPQITTALGAALIAAESLTI